MPFLEICPKILIVFASTWDFFSQNVLRKLLGFLKQIMEIWVEFRNFLVEKLGQNT